MKEDLVDFIKDFVGYLPELASTIFSGLKIVLILSVILGAMVIAFSWIIDKVTMSREIDLMDYAILVDEIKEVCPDEMNKFKRIYSEKAYISIREREDIRRSCYEKEKNRVMQNLLEKGHASTPPISH